MEKLELLSGLRQKGESSKAIQACNDWLRLGPGRSISGLLKKYSDSDQNLAVTTSRGTLLDWSAKFNWQARAEGFDAELEELKNARRREVMETGLALDYERVDTLKSMAQLLIDNIREEGEEGTLHNVWLKDVKQIGMGMLAERVDIERFNASIFEQMRGMLEDIAKEKGERKGDKGVQVNGGGDIKVYVGLDLDRV